MNTTRLFLPVAFFFLFSIAATLPACRPDEKQCDTALQDSLNVREIRLKEREMALREREMAVAEKEQALGIRTSSPDAGSSAESASGTAMNDNGGRQTVKGGRTDYSEREQKAAYKKPVLANPGQFPESSERLLTADDLVHKSAFGKRVMLNEIYARHGFIFTEPDMKKHFNGESWYKGTEKSMAKLKLTATELQNVAFIRSHQ